MPESDNKTRRIAIEAEKARRVYRLTLDTVRKLDEILKKKRAYRDVFLPESVHLRNKLKEYCERLMFFDPIEYGRKAEELLWRKVFYDIIQLMKHNKKNTRPNVSYESAFRTHLAASTGYYHHLLSKLQRTYNLRLEGIADFHEIFDHKSYTKPHLTKKKDTDPRIEDWAIRACHRCLVYLGDIARYQQDYDGTRSHVLSQRYYYQALALYPDIGMPHNQLGTLAGNKHYNCDAAYHYLRCIMCPTSFEGAQGNLNRLFEKNVKRFQDITQHSSPRALPPEQQRPKDIKRFLVRVMHLLHIFHNCIQTSEASQIQEFCQSTLHDFNLCMLYQPTASLSSRKRKEHEERPQYLEDGLVFKIVVMLIITICTQHQTSSKLVTAAIAFALALFSHILNHTVMRLQSALYEAENPHSILNSDVDESSSTDEELIEKSENLDLETGEAREEQNSLSPDGSLKKGKHSTRRRRRRPKRGVQDGSSDDSDLSEGGASPEEEEDHYSDSDDDIVNYMNNSDSSSETEDDLMESQELRPGFATSATPEQLEGQLERLDLQALQKNYTSGTFPGMGTDINNTQMLPGLNEASTNFPLEEWLISSANFMQSELDLNSLGIFPNMQLPLTPTTPKADVDSDYQLCRDVMQGKKDVKVPPGFDKDPETLHVEEIGRKIAAFVIDTDTDRPTDTDNSSVPTESEHGDTETDEQNSDAGSVIDKAELESRRLTRLIDVIAAEGLHVLPTVKVICDWMKCHQNIVSTCAKSSQGIWSRLSLLLNFLPLESDISTIDVCQSQDLLNIVQKTGDKNWMQTQPLKEDILLHNLLPIMEAHSSITFDVKKRLELDERQETLIRICCLRKFGHSMTKIRGINLTYNAEKNIFIGPLQQSLPNQEEDEKIAQQKMAETEARRNQLMRDMAQLRLQAEVSELEGTLKTTDQPSLPPYLVPDASALCDSLMSIKQMANSSRFIIIIPLAVIDKLDMLKKDSPGAREAIRWLEIEFRKGNRYVRAQKTHERIHQAMLHTNLKKKDREAWTLNQLTECCRYLAQQNTEYDPKGMVTVLTNQKLASPDVSLRVRQAAAAAEKEGFRIQNVNDFHKKWKDVWKNNAV